MLTDRAGLTGPDRRQAVAGVGKQEQAHTPSYTVTPTPTEHY